MDAVYNENGSYPAQWLRNLIAAQHIAAGRVDERSIVDLRPCDVAGAGQRHFFAGIGVWSHALRLAGWPDDRSIWTGSCPCQPFSAAGRGRGVEDERHLWPEWFRLISECRPPIVVGEQVASPAGLGWFDAVSSDLEGEGYAVGAADLCAAGVGAPHIRQRLFFVAIADEQQGDLHATKRQQGRGVPDADRDRAARGLAHLRGQGLEVVREQQARGQLPAPERGGAAGVMAHDTTGRRREGSSDMERCGGGSHARGDGAGSADDRRPLALANMSGARRSRRRTGDANPNDGRDAHEPGRRGDAGQLGDAGREGGGRNAGAVHRAQARGTGERAPSRGQSDELVAASADGGMADANEPDAHDEREPRGRGLVQPAQNSTAGFWHSADWIPCADGRSRPVEPGTFPLVAGAAARVGRLRAYGNAIVAPLAAEFIRSIIEIYDHE